MTERFTFLFLMFGLCAAPVLTAQHHGTEASEAHEHEDLLDDDVELQGGENHFHPGAPLFRVNIHRHATAVVADGDDADLGFRVVVGGEEGRNRGRKTSAGAGWDDGDGDVLSQTRPKVFKNFKKFLRNGKWLDSAT